jgi:hypothetical protein
MNKGGLEITSITGNGSLSWTNSLNPSANYRVEWATTPTGVWQRSFQVQSLIEAQSNTDFRCRFRCVARSWQLSFSVLSLIDLY